MGQDALGRGDTNAISVYLPATVNFVYDSNGNLTSDGRRGFDYDDENQLTRVTVTNAWKSEFLYDGRMRRRVRKEFVWQNSAWAQTAEVRYVYDGMLVIQERDGNNVPRVAYTRGLDLGSSLDGAGGIGGLLARTDQQTVTPQHAYYHADGNGNVTALVNDKQILVAKYLYDTFGNILAKSGPLAEANTYRFSSKEVHESSGLYYYGYRFYDPNLQRWLNQDPIGEEGGINLYRFTINSPINYVDSDGRAIMPPPPFQGPGTRPPSPEWHKNRNRYNRCPTKEPKSGKCPLDYNWKPDRFSGGHGGTVYRSPEGFECVYDKNGNLLPDNGTFNYGPNPFSPGHILFDVFPHYFFYPEYPPGQTGIY